MAELEQQLNSAKIELTNIKNKQAGQKIKKKKSSALLTDSGMGLKDFDLCVTLVFPQPQKKQK